MSADNWTQCHRCVAKAEEEQATLQQQVVSGYGTLPLPEFDELRARAERPISLDNSLREDYEIGIVEGEFYARYHGQCKNCGFNFEWKHDEKVP